MYTKLPENNDGGGDTWMTINTTGLFCPVTTPISTQSGPKSPVTTFVIMSQDRPGWWKWRGTSETGKGWIGLEKWRRGAFFIRESAWTTEENWEWKVWREQPWLDQPEIALERAESTMGEPGCQRDEYVNGVVYKSTTVGSKWRKVDRTLNIAVWQQSRLALTILIAFQNMYTALWRLWQLEITTGWHEALTANFT